MMQFVLIGLGAGAAAALLFASMVTGSLLSVPLVFLSPLPIMIAGLGWSHWAALTAALVGALALGIAFEPLSSVSFMAFAGLPGWWLSYLAMLARPVGDGAAALEWYPPGRLLVWAAFLGTFVVLVAIPHFGLDAETFHANSRKLFAAVLRAETGTPKNAPLVVPGVSNVEHLLDFIVAAIPPMVAVLATWTNAFNLWIAAVVVRFSGRLKRPWPAIAAMTFPRALLGVFAAAMVLSFVDSLVGVAAGVLSASLLVVYGILGFAVLHTITRGVASRVFLLGGVYMAVLVLGWPMLTLCLLGLIEAVADLRARLAATRGPPAIT
jgi:hypothetical protein